MISTWRFIIPHKIIEFYHLQTQNETNLITVEVIVFWFFKRFISYYSDSWSSKDEMGQFMITNEIYGEVAKIVNGVSINLYYLRYFQPKYSFVF